MLEAERHAVKWEAYHNSLNILEREMAMSESPARPPVPAFC